MSTRTLDRDEVEAILRVALQRADAVEGLTRDELAEVAAEVGIPLTDLDGAIELIEREREKRTADPIAQMGAVLAKEYSSPTVNVPSA